MDLIEFELT